ncbi:hypothetical protein K443DRAFT_632337 [Laccaria amethystina LaAM-08-1]|uniref:Uncharacterized protein n=1 Tax=Laccaria amethystina LaAM-08-1 TaxID=1095629 RepID=A0A0C9XI28_9AGAR|nr:hypothetical protein K443DRAFT_632337 [Laccaria amethystina LaAM-08-1]
MQAIGGSRIRVHHSFDALSSLRLSQSQLFFAILPNILVLLSPLSSSSRLVLAFQMYEN